MDRNGLKWLDINGNGFNILEMFKFMMLLLWHQKCQGGVTLGFRCKTSMQYRTVTVYDGANKSEGSAYRIRLDKESQSGKAHSGPCTSLSGL